MREEGCYKNISNAASRTWKRGKQKRQIGRNKEAGQNESGGLSDRFPPLLGNGRERDNSDNSGQLFKDPGGQLRPTGSRE